MPANEYLPFAAGGGALVQSQADYAASAARTGGFQSGIADPAQLNKPWRQASVMISALAALLAARTGLDLLDDGDVSALVAKMNLALADPDAEVLSFNTRTGAVTLTSGDVTGALGYTPDAAGASRPPSGAAGGKLTGNYPNPGISLASGDVTGALGFTPDAAGTARPPNGSAGGALTGSFPNPSLAGFTSSLGPNGYVTLPGGLIIQWGSVTVTTGGSVNQTFNYPIAFPNSVYIAFGNSAANNSSGGAAGSGSSLSQGVAWASNSGAVVGFVAIGR